MNGKGEITVIDNVNHAASCKESVEKLRMEIDDIDDDLIRLLEKRFELSCAIGDEKKKEKREVKDGKREQFILEKIEKRAPEFHGEIALLYARLFELSRGLQNRA